MKSQEIVELLEDGRNPFWAKVDRRHSLRFAAEFAAWPLRQPLPPGEDCLQWRRRQLVRFLVRHLEGSLAELAERRSSYADYLQRLSATDDDLAARQHMLDFLRYLGAKPRQLRRDNRAFARWFGADGVAERFAGVCSELERKLIYLADRLGELTSVLVSRQKRHQLKPFWDQLKLEPAIFGLLTFVGDARVLEAGFRCISRVIAALPGELRMLLDSTTVAYTYRAAFDRRQPLWIQCEAMSLISRLVPAELDTILQRRLVDPPLNDSDDMFFRRRAVVQIARRWPQRPQLLTLLDHAVVDPSAFVRQGVAEVLPQLPNDAIARLSSRLLEDAEPAVRGRALLGLPKLVAQPALQDVVDQWLDHTLTTETPTEVFVLRTALHIVPLIYQELLKTGGAAEKYRERIQTSLTHLHIHHERTDVRRWAAQSRNHLWHLQPRYAAAREMLSKLRELPLSKRRGLTLDEPLDEVDLGRLLSVLAENEFGFDLQRTRRGWRVLRDYRWGFRLWRLLAEWRRPASDKRQNYSHLKGRVYRGLVHVPALAVAEVSQTKIPGEPLHIEDEGGYRPYLPLPDHLLSSLDQGWPNEPLRIYSSEGVLWLTPPSNLFSRLTAKLKLSWRFDKIARLRNWNPASPFAADAYVAEIQKLGFKTHFKTYADEHLQPFPNDPRIGRFFPAVLPLNLPLLWRDAQEYFYSVYQNTLANLLIFVTGIASLFFGSHLWANWQMRRARRQIPLVVGGWGTRGKSGTERLKAAVFNGLGYRIVSKTTGCEAMFLHGHANRPVREMFLFRPYDKATIWEQVFLVRLSARLKTDIFIWECMGLTPRYIRILQRQWMRDDLATICNCYPDHEDIQGPAGIDIPQVMQLFVPPGKVLVTSEENMLPFLTQEARARKTQMHTVNWLQANLITPDILARFPYEEHPYNIALVTKVSEVLGIAADFSLKEQADRVVADLGVLKAYAPAPIRGRTLEFINGCSANERHGTLSNWRRMAMAEHRLDADPSVWTCTVVNNRADRIARSQVFAAILVKDIGADRHFLIGDNLDGFVSYVRDSFDRFAGQIKWEQTDADQVTALQEKLSGLARRWKVPRSNHEVMGRLNAMLEGVGAEPVNGMVDEAIIEATLAEHVDDSQHRRIVSQWRQDEIEQQQFAALAGQIGKPRPGTQQDFTHQLWQWLEARLVIVEDYHATGNQIIDQLAGDTPPGLRNRTMGLQNIKGTGLDFVYRWQAWGYHYDACQDLLSDDEQRVQNAARLLTTSQEFGLLEQEYVAGVIKQASESPHGQTELVQAELRTASSNLLAQLKQVNMTSGTESDGESRWWKPLANWLEALLDAGDAVRRRKTADRIYKDLGNQRISAARAAKELKSLTRRQKGGWLVKQIGLALAARNRT